MPHNQAFHRGIFVCQLIRLWGFRSSKGWLYRFLIFALILLFCGCLCFVSLPLRAMGWPAVSECSFSISYSVAFFRVPSSYSFIRQPHTSRQTPQQWRPLAVIFPSENTVFWWKGMPPLGSLTSRGLVAFEACIVFACGALAASICVEIVIPSTWLSIYITHC